MESIAGYWCLRGACLNRRRECGTAQGSGCAARQVLNSQERTALTTAYRNRRKQELVELCYLDKAKSDSHHFQYMASVVITGVRNLYETTILATDPNFVVTTDAPTAEECPP